MNTNNTRGRSLLLATDGSCLGNPGPGGWAVIVHEREGDAVVSRYALAGRADGYTTNTQMELEAAIEAMKTTSAHRCPVNIMTDSQYVKNGLTVWLPKWKTNGWRTSDRKPVKNRDQWETLDRLSQDQDVNWQWVKAHAGHDMNEAVDGLARDAAWGLCERSRGELADLYPELFSSNPSADLQVC